MLLRCRYREANKLSRAQLRKYVLVFHSCNICYSLYSSMKQSEKLNCFVSCFTVKVEAKFILSLFL